MIEVKNLSKDYVNRCVLHNISFTVDKGEVLGFLGPNGAGKTTTMRLLTGFLMPTNGTIRIADYDIHKEPNKVKEHIGYLPENVPLYDELNVIEYLNFITKIRKVPAKERKQRIDSIMQKVGLIEEKNTLIKRLSKGYKQRVGLAQALVHNPQVLILDEPTVGLDPKQIVEVRELIKELGKEHTVILSTHILSEVNMICERVIILNEGRIVAEGTAEGLVNRLQDEEMYDFEIIGALEKLRLLLDDIQIKWELLSEENKDGISLVRFRIECEEISFASELARKIILSDMQLQEMRHHKMSLEDIFLQAISS